MPSICFYFQVHQPFRIRNYSFFDIGNDHYYEDEKANQEIMNKVAEKCYLKTNRKMLDLIRRLRAAGHAVVVISHNLENVFAVADRICVLRLGRDAGSFDTASTSRGDIVAAITGAGTPQAESAGVAA